VKLIETMRVTVSGEVYLLERHLERLSRSAKFFSFEYDRRKVHDEIVKAVPADGLPLCLRLTLSREGVLQFEIRPLPPRYASRLILSTVRVDTTDVSLYHKTTNRGVYDQARQECDAETDAILANERGEITETTVANVAVFRDERWVTPHLSCGVLPGVMREELLARREIVEGVIRSEDLMDGERVRCFNALRGVSDVEFAGSPNVNAIDP